MLLKYFESLWVNMFKKRKKTEMPTTKRSICALYHYNILTSSVPCATRNPAWNPIKQLCISIIEARLEYITWSVISWWLLLTSVDTDWLAKHLPELGDSSNLAMPSLPVSLSLVWSLWRPSYHLSDDNLSRSLALLISLPYLLSVGLLINDWRHK